MTFLTPIPRYVGLGLLLVMALVTAAGFHGIRKDIDSLQEVSADNFLWSATQMEVELLRFHRDLALFLTKQNDDALADVRERFDILWSRVGLMDQGRVGEVLRRYDQGHDSIARFRAFLTRIDPAIVTLQPGDTETVRTILDALDDYQHEMRLYTLRVVRGDTATSSMIRERVQTGSQITAVISLSAVLVSILALFLIMRESLRHREIADLNRRAADQAEAASRAKSRFLTMMSHEMRNPLNGILGPLALLQQSDLAQRHQRLVEQARQSGRAMLGMLSSLLEWGEMQEGRLELRREPFRPRALADRIAAAVNGPGDAAPRLELSLHEDMPEFLYGDLDRLAQIYGHLTEYVMPARVGGRVTLEFFYQAGNLVGDIGVADADDKVDWKIGLLMGMNDQMPEPFSTDALGPLISRGLISAAHGILTLADAAKGRRIVRVSIPAERVAFEQIRVHLETRSTALATIYQAALRNDRVVFNPPDSSTPADIVLVDSTSVGETPLMTRLRTRFPDALFVSLGLPETPGFFDDIVEIPTDLTRLRESILGRLAS